MIGLMENDDDDDKWFCLNMYRYMSCVTYCVTDSTSCIHVTFFPCRHGRFGEYIYLVALSGFEPPIDQPAYINAHVTG
jgi:hypothetical protein